MYDQLYDFCFEIRSTELIFGYYNYNKQEEYNIHEIYVALPYLISIFEEKIGNNNYIQNGCFITWDLTYLQTIYLTYFFRNNDSNLQECYMKQRYNHDIHLDDSVIENIRTEEVRLFFEEIMEMADDNLNKFITEEITNDVKFIDEYYIEFNRLNDYLKDKFEYIFNAKKFDLI